MINNGILGIVEPHGHDVRPYFSTVLGLFIPVLVFEFEVTGMKGHMECRWIQLFIEFHS